VARHLTREESIVKLRGIVATTALVCLAGSLVGCSSDSKSSSTTSSTTSKDKVCSDKTAVESSVKALTNPDVLTGGKSSITSALDKVEKNVNALGTSVKADLKPQVDAVKSALDALKTDVKNVGNGSLADSLQQIGDAIAKVGTTAGDLESSLSSQCPSS
jgi:hypothetical protein